MFGSIESLLEELDDLPDEFVEIKVGVRKAVQVAPVDPDMALTRIRKVLEYIIRVVFQRQYNEKPGTRPLENLIQRLTNDGFFPGKLNAYATVIRQLGNVGTHSFHDDVTEEDCQNSLTQLVPILDWFIGWEGAAEQSSRLASRKKNLQNRGSLKDARSSPLSSRPNLPPADSDNPLLALWDCLEPSLQDAFSLAYNKKRRQGGNRISTKDFFQALVRLADDSLKPLLASLPEGALPEPVDSNVLADKQLVLEESPLLSDCVAESLEHFRDLNELPRKITPADLFVDIAKNGHGESVARLRRHGMGAREIEERVSKLGMSVIRRVSR
jgi:hypothetical protein